MKRKLIPTLYRVIAVSQCEELEGSQTLGVYESELQALTIEALHRKEYWQLKIEEICSKCEETLEECCCQECHCRR